VFLWSGAEGEIETGWPDYPAIWTNIEFESRIPVDIVGAGTYVAAVNGKINLQSGLISITSYGSDEPIGPSK
jgi:hypothetical protein